MSIEFDGYPAGYTAESGALTEDIGAGTTTITIDLTGDLPTQEVNIVVGATGLTLDDVTFVGQTPTSLAVA